MKTENVNSLKHVHHLTIATESHAVEVRQTEHRSTQKSLGKLSQQAGMLYSSCCYAVKTLQLFPYKVHVIQQLSAPDCEKHNYCEWLSAKVEAAPLVFAMTLSSEEAWFHLACYVNSQNTYIWLTENPNAVHETPFHPDKIWVWCATACHGMVGPIFFEKSIHLECYNVTVHKFLGLHM
jgi:hypothetical protein